MKLQQLQEEIEQTIEDKVERSKVMEGTLGDILNSTQVREGRISAPFWLLGPHVQELVHLSSRIISS